MIVGPRIGGGSQADVYMATYQSATVAVKFFSGETRCESLHSFAEEARLGCEHDEYACVPPFATVSVEVCHGNNAVGVVACCRFAPSFCALVCVCVCVVVLVRVRVRVRFCFPRGASFLFCS
jgi:hypothetical protein